MQRPGPVRPARPARWSAAARLIRPSSQRSMPRCRVVTHDPRQTAVDHGGDAIDRQRRLRDVGAENDLAAIARPSARSWSSAGSEPCKRQHQGPSAARPPARAVSPPGGSRPDPAERPGDGPRRADRISRSSMSGTIVSALAGRSTGRYSQRTPRCVFPSTRTIGQSSRNRATGSASSVADMTTRIKSGRTSAPDFAQQRQRQVAIQVALVKFVEDDGADRFEKRVGQELPGQDALGEEPQAGLGREPSFEADLVADLVAEGPALFLGDPAPRRPAPPRAAAGARSRPGARPTAGPTAGWPAAPASSCPSRGAPPRPPSAPRGPR